MLFSSTVFIFLFLPIVLGVYYTILRKNRIAQNVFLCIASLFFYAWGEPAFVFIMILSIFLNYIFGILVDKYRDDKSKSKVILCVSVIFNIGLLFIFKYLVFFLKNFNIVFGLTLPVPEIVLPIGISFFTFQAMSYVIDVYRQNGEVQKNPLNLGLYISFFPQLIAGPIVRYETVAYQIQHRKENFNDFSEGICRFIMGLAKKVLLANTLAIVADNAFNTNTDELSASFAWIGAIAYTFQIYFDFGGYSDMAIGLGRMFGFKFLENFNYPYISKSVSEFWRRWHISLGTWFRDYVYFPLGGSRVKSKGRLIFNLLVVWFLTGVWHGANWTFVLWGLLYFVILAIEKLTNIEKRNVGKFNFLRHIYTLLFVILGWVLFRADTVGQAFSYMGAMFGGTGIIIDNNALFALNENLVYFIAGLLISTPLCKIIHSKIENKKALTSSIAVVGLTFLFMISVIYIVKGAYNPFIYFNF